MVSTTAAIWDISIDWGDFDYLVLQHLGLFQKKRVQPLA
jgi:hypothetical protein